MRAGPAAAAQDSRIWGQRLHRTRGPEFAACWDMLRALPRRAAASCGSIRPQRSRGAAPTSGLPECRVSVVGRESYSVLTGLGLPCKPQYFPQSLLTPALWVP